MRAWIDDEEVTDVHRRFAAVQLPAEPIPDISGASGVPLILALATKGAWSGHVPGPHGLPGGYPVRLAEGLLTLDLPPSLGRDEAVHWNAQFEERNGVVVHQSGQVEYTGALLRELHAVSPQLALGFHVEDIDEAWKDMSALRARLQGAG